MCGELESVGEVGQTLPPNPSPKKLKVKLKKMLHFLPIETIINDRPVFSYKLRYIVGFELVDISTNPKR